MRAQFTVVIVCADPEACFPFRKSLENYGFRLISLRDRESAIAGSRKEPIDGVLICQEDVRVGALGLHLKARFCDTPVVLISTGCETIGPPNGIDAVCYTNALDDQAACVMMWLFRDQLTEPSYPPHGRLDRDDERPGPSVVRS